MKTQRKKLILEKLEIAKLRRPDLVSGGNGDQGDTLPTMRPTKTKPTRKK